MLYDVYLFLSFSDKPKFLSCWIFWPSWLKPKEIYLITKKKFTFFYIFKSICLKGTVSPLHPFTFLFTELGSSSVPRIMAAPESLDGVSFYEDEHGHLIPHIVGSFHYIAVEDNLIIGIYINGVIHRIYDREGYQIVITIGEERNIRMTRELHQAFNHLFLQRPIRRVRSISLRSRG